MYLLQGNKHLLTLNLLMEEVIYKKNNPEFKSYQFSGNLNYYITHVHFWYISL